MCNFVRRHHKEQFCEIILNLDKWFRRCCLKIFLIWSSGVVSRALAAPLFSGAEPLVQFGRRNYKKNCELF